jgi:hypothetical protein
VDLGAVEEPFHSPSLAVALLELEHVFLLRSRWELRLDSHFEDSRLHSWFGIPVGTVPHHMAVALVTVGTS